MIYYTEELSHYGVKGMKWGVRKERKASDSANTNADKLKKAAKIGAAVAATALVAYGGYKISKLHNEAINDLSRSYIRKGKNQMAMYSSARELASRSVQYADQSKIRGGSKVLQKHHLENAEYLRKKADEHFDIGADLISKGQNKNFTKKEVVGQMAHIAKRRYDSAKSVRKARRG